MTAPGINQLLTIIEQQLDWGDAATWQSRGFENLNELIFEKTKISLSASTLRRVWGRVEYNHLPSGTTLDTLARFAGFGSWRSFTKENLINGTIKQVESAPVKEPFIRTKFSDSANFRVVIALFIIAVIIISLAGMYVKKTPSAAKTAFSFDSRPVTRTIPNSVIFTYDVKTNPGDSVFIQQSWDPGTRVAVDKAQHKYTSIYYLPGFYHARLKVMTK